MLCQWNNCNTLLMIVLLLMFFMFFIVLIIWNQLLDSLSIHDGLTNPIKIDIVSPLATPYRHAYTKLFCVVVVCLRQIRISVCTKNKIILFKNVPGVPILILLSYVCPAKIKDFFRRWKFGKCYQDKQTVKFKLP